MFKNLFSKRKKKVEATKTKKKSYAGDTKIPYKSKLIPVLLNEHKALLSLYGDILAAANAKDADRTKLKLNKFKDLFSGHLIKENVSLYTYLSHSITDNDTSEAINLMKSEMYGIGKEVNSFLRHYTSEHADIDNVFIEKLEGLGEALVRRIENEEAHLYPVYQPV